MSELDRRAFLRLAGGSILAAGALAACTDDGGGNSDDAGDESEPDAPDPDVVALQTAKALEGVAVDVYRQALESGLLLTPGLVETVTQFQGHHREHGDALVTSIEAAGGEPLTGQADTALTDLGTRVVTTEADVVAWLLEIENVLAQTYAADAGAWEDRTLDVTTMEIGAVEARHAAALGPIVGQPAAPVAILPTTAAVAAGTGVDGG